MPDADRQRRRARSLRTVTDRVSALVPAGLRWRLTAWVAVVLLLASAITFVAIYRGTGSQLRRQIDRELASDTATFTRDLAPAHGRAPALAAAAAAYVRNQPFRATSRVLFLAAPGVGTVTNEPELLGLARGDDTEPAGVQATENRLARALLAAPAGLFTVDVADLGSADVSDLRVLISPLRLADGRVGRIGVGEPLTSVRQAQEAIVRAFLLAGALSLIAAVLASYLIGARVTRPLRRMARIAARVDGGDLAPRIHAGEGSPDEVRVLAHAFDRMLDRLADAFARQRSFVADASHELRTPLTVIRGQLEVLAREASPAGEDVRHVEGVVQAEVARMSRLVDELLLLARSEEAEFLRREEIDLEQYVRELWDGASLVAEREYELQMQTAGTLWADPDRLAQALRNLIGNAIEHTEPTRGRVLLTVRAVDGGRVRFGVHDDGPGIAPDQRDRIFDRFHRTDAARNRAYGGTGLGLAIVQAIADAHGGSVAAGASDELGGAYVELELPGLRAERPSPTGSRTRARARAGIGAGAGTAGAGTAGAGTAHHAP